MNTNILFSSSSLNIGTHVPFNKSLYKTINFALSTGMYSIQFFLGSPQSFNRTILDDNDIFISLKIKDRYPMSIFTHAPYIYNLAKELKDNIPISSLEKELNHVSLFGEGVVLHPGSNPNKKQGILDIAKNISKINFQNNSKLILENMSGQGNMLGSTFQELRDIRNNIEEQKRKHIGFCIDTAHIWGMGLYDLSDEKQIDKMFQDIDHILGIENITLFHVNDSKALFGSKLDRHELLGEGKIWNQNGDALRYLLRSINLKSIPIILETDPSDIRKFLY